MAFPPLPIAALLRRELVRDLRRPRSFIVLALFAGACIVGVGMAWPEQERLYSGLAEISEGFIWRISLMLFGTCVLVIPALAAGAVVVEREQETYDLLHLTLVPPRSVLLAKIFSVAGFYLLLVVAALPVLATAFFLIGVEWRTVAQIVAVLLTTALACASAGLMSSARSRRITRAVIGSYLGVLALMTAGPIFVFFASLVLMPVGLLSSIGASVEAAFTVGTPIGTLLSLFGGTLSRIEFLFALGVQLGFIILCLAVALRALQRPPVTPRIEQFKPIDDPRILRERRRTFPYYLVDPLKRKKPIQDRWNPVLVRELRWGLMDRASTLIRVFYISFLFYLLIGGVGFIAGGRTYGFMLGWLLLQIAGTVLIAPATLASTFTREFETGSMDMLRTTLLTPREIVVGKLFAGMTAIAPLILAAVASAVPLLPWVIDEADLIVTGYVTLLLCALLCLALGLVASLITTRTTTALVLTYLFALVVFLGTWVASTFIPQHGYRVLQFLKSPILVFWENAWAHEKAEEVGSLFNTFWMGNQVLFWLLALLLVKAAVTGYAHFRLRET